MIPDPGQRDGREVRQVFQDPLCSQPLPPPKSVVEVYLRLESCEQIELPVHCLPYSALGAVS